METEIFVSIGALLQTFIGVKNNFLPTLKPHFCFGE